MTENRKTILIVEDNDDNVDIYSTVLTYNGYRVIVARDGEAGVAAAQREHPALVLMDVTMPLLDGWEATLALKADPATAGIPVIALTARALPADQERAREVGCDGYISKPANPLDVLEAVRRYVGDPTAP
ncbi:response regulator [soil metagenome]